MKANSHLGVVYHIWILYNDDMQTCGACQGSVDEPGIDLPDFK